MNIVVLALYIIRISPTGADKDGPIYELEKVQQFPFDEEDKCLQKYECLQNPSCNESEACKELTNCSFGFCECAPGFIGWRCEYATCKDSLLCKNDGECFIHENKHYCDCKEYYDGHYCEKFLCDNQTNCDGVCNDSKCIFDTRVMENDAFKANCSKLNPCANGGKCKVEDNKYNCTCDQWWVGPRCWSPVCNASWCNGLCHEDDCICQPGYYGDGCQLSNCSLFSGCDFVNATCVDDHNDIRCNCDTKLFAGRYCESPCEFSCNNGLCGSDGSCYCDESYQGKVCNISTIIFSSAMMGGSDSSHFIVLCSVGLLILGLIWIFWKGEPPKRQKKNFIQEYGKLISNL